MRLFPLPSRPVASSRSDFCEVLLARSCQNLVILLCSITRARWIFDEEAHLTGRRVCFDIEALPAKPSKPPSALISSSRVKNLRSQIGTEGGSDLGLFSHCHQRPVPRVIAWSAFDTRVGSAYMIMEKVNGITSTNASRIEDTCLKAVFSHFGSLYYKEDVTPELQKLALYANSSQIKDGADRFRIGHSTAPEDRNIIITPEVDERMRLAGLIEWQYTRPIPACLGSPIPHAFEYQDRLITMPAGFDIPSLPDDYDTLSRGIHHKNLSVSQWTSSDEAVWISALADQYDVNYEAVFTELQCGEDGMMPSADQIKVDGRAPPL
ncbi:hypothetical protein BS47DRAFT_1488269 [Hydnum rufescens UP504]|uniref:Uncharacterized protein n=1 Tax=Hydnum rufescens UP504 TaxID=1448309 RepID=A0A9P6AN17_9AGAM|nr:hypothetical protein BS47DRAFT_1488269 [Hydnum rufescens UP504]